MLLRSITLLLLFAVFAKVKSKEIKITKNSFENYDVDALRERSEKSVIHKNLYQDDNTTHESLSNGEKITRSKRLFQDPWIVKDFEDFENLPNFHAFVVRDENIPPCGMAAQMSTHSRYFMCSGAILSERHAITTASCIHFAHIYEHHVSGDMAVLVGATTYYNQVIKITRIEIHPHYDYNAESANNALHNLAILHLECPICRGLASIPQLPCNPYEDLGHLCCSDRCKILTVVQRSDNRHTIRLLSAKHLPLPEHKDEKQNGEKEIALAEMTSINGRRSIRSPAKLAAPPLFFTQEQINLNSTNENFQQNQIEYNDGRRSGNENNPSATNNTHRKILEDFTKNFVNTMITRLEDLVRSHNNSKTVPIGRADVGTNRIENETTSDITEALMKKLVSGVLNKIDVKDEPMARGMKKDILETYVHCPPLGTPVISTDILVGMVAYTCDDAQDWVPWRYVEISKNMDWIMDRLQNGNGESTKNYLTQKRSSTSKQSFSTTCSEPVQSTSNSCVNSGNGGSNGSCGG